jgi:hypothetical protein
MLTLKLTGLPGYVFGMPDFGLLMGLTFHRIAS